MSFSHLPQQLVERVAKARRLLADPVSSLKDNAEVAQFVEAMDLTALLHDLFSPRRGSRGRA